MRSVNPTLTFDGTAEQAFAFYRSVFGGEFTSLMRWRDAPFAERVPPGDRDKIMHAALPLMAGSVLMGGDAAMGHRANPGGAVSICLEADSPAEATRLFDALAAGGTVTMPLQKAFWGALNGMCTDRFGIGWMVNYTLPT